VSAELEGRAFLVGDDVDTDLLAPGAYMKAPIEELARHCLEALDPDFARSVQPGGEACRPAAHDNHVFNLLCIAMTIGRRHFALLYRLHFSIGSLLHFL